MATSKNAITTYIPDDSKAWLEEYCQSNTQLLNSEGKPKLGTAIADIIFRLATGDLTLPTVQQGTVPQSDGEVMELKKLVYRLVQDVEKLKEKSTLNVPYSTVPESTEDNGLDSGDELATDEHPAIDGEVRELTYSKFCEMAGIPREGTSAQPSKDVAEKSLKLAEANGVTGWKWESTTKKYVKVEPKKSQPHQGGS